MGTTEISVLFPAATDPCVDLACGKNEWCGEKEGRWGCFCQDDNGPAQKADYGKQKVLALCIFSLKQNPESQYL